MKNKKINKITITIIIILLLLQCSGNGNKKSVEEIKKNNNNEVEILNITEIKEVNRKEELNIEEVKKFSDKENKEILKITEIKQVNIKEELKVEEVKKNANQEDKEVLNIENTKKENNSNLNPIKNKKNINIKKIPKGFEELNSDLYIKLIINKKNNGFIKGKIEDNKLIILDDIIYNKKKLIKKDDKLDFIFSDEDYKYKYNEEKEELLIVSKNQKEKTILKTENNNFNIHQVLNNNINKGYELNYGFGGRLSIKNGNDSIKTLWYKRDENFLINDLYWNKNLSNHEIKLGYLNISSLSNSFLLDNRILGLEINEKQINTSTLDVFIKEESIIRIYKEGELIYTETLEEGSHKLPYNLFPIGSYELKIEIDNGFDKESYYTFIENDMNGGYSLSIGAPINQDKDILFNTKDTYLIKISDRYKFNNISFVPEIIYQDSDINLSGRLNYSKNNYSADFKFFNGENKKGININYNYKIKDLFLSGSFDKLKFNNNKYENYNINASYKLSSNKLIGLNAIYRKNYRNYLEDSYDEYFDYTENLNDLNDYKKYSIYFKSNLYRNEGHNIGYRLSASKNNIEYRTGIQFYYYFGNYEDTYNINLEKEEDEFNQLYSYNKIMKREDGISNFNIKKNNDRTNINYYKSNYLGLLNANIDQTLGTENYSVNYRTNIIYTENEMAISGNNNNDTGILLKVNGEINEFYYSINNGQKIKVKDRNKIFVPLLENKKYIIQVYPTEKNIGYDIDQEIRKVYLEKGNIEKIEWNISKSYYLITKLNINGIIIKNKKLLYNNEMIFSDDNGIINIKVLENEKLIKIDDMSCEIPKKENNGVLFIEYINCKKD